MKKILWFSRHDMTTQQKQALVNKFGEIQIFKVNGSMDNIHKPFEAETQNGDDETKKETVIFKDLVKTADIVAIVAPIGLQQQILGIAGDKPVIIAKSDRIVTKNEDGGEDKVVFQFAKWERIVKIEVLMEDF